MKRRTPLLAGALTALSIAALAMPASSLAAATTDSQTQFLSLLNADRQAGGLPPLAVDTTLSSIATQRAQQELASGTLSHYDSSGNLVFQSLLNTSGVQYTSAGENLAENNYPLTQSVAQANSALMASPTHAANILNPSYNAVGIAIAGPGPGGQYYYTEIFGQLPRAASGGMTTAPSTTTTTTTAQPTDATSTTTTSATTQQGDDDERAEAIEHHAQKELEKAEKLEDRADKLEHKAAKLDEDRDDERSDHLQQRAIRLEDEAKRLEAAAQRLQQLAAQLLQTAKTTTAGDESHHAKGCAFGNDQAEGQTATAPGCVVARQHRGDEQKPTAPAVAPTLSGAGVIAARHEIEANMKKAAKAVKNALEKHGRGDQGHKGQ